MVSGLSLVAMVVTLLICMVVPIVALIVYAVKNKGKGVWLAWFIGAAGFFVMQIIIRTPILSLLSLNQGFVEFANNHYIAYVAILAFTAALFELIARVIGANILKKKRSYEVAFGAGLGHGGIEAIVLIGMTYINNLLYSAMINTGAFDAMVESTAQMGVDAAVLQATIDQYNNAVATGVDELTGRTLLVATIDEGPYFAAKRVPSAHHTMGGVEISTETHVLDTEGNWIEGLYAAGEVVGGCQGDLYLPSSTFTWAMTSGVQAGKVVSAALLGE